ncbi:MAG: endo-1,4-beta-xylanase [Planctomycetes bacterium]|nr:endo-1,4-beta-xylanase [Planctomycetota bacterium]
MNERAQELINFLQIDDPEVESRIDSGIENNRKGFGKLTLLDSAGKEIEKAKIKLKQKGHEFQFGCNAFMLDQFPEKEQNENYRETFTSLFNLAVVPFYWSDLEPEDGELRFDKNSRKIYRRPQPDLVLEFCNEHNITPKGHPLLWHHFRPEWLTHDQQGMRERINRRFREIAERYADKIKIWDVCNEAQTMSTTATACEMPDNHVELAFELARRYFPDCTKTYNDDRMWFHYTKTYSPVYLLVKSLLDRGYMVDALGLQYHMFEWQLHYANKFMNPHLLFNCLDTYGSLGLPINFSEVSIISRRDLGDGDGFQKIVVERLYRLWFSHAAVNGIIWWNMVDGTAAYAPLGSEEGENSLRAGLVNFDFTPKPAFTALHSLIKKDWQTEATLEYSAGATNKFKGFYGEYDAVIETDARTFRKTVNLSKGSLNDFKLEIG